jgi:hypothetical protein
MVDMLPLYRTVHLYSRLPVGVRGLTERYAQDRQKQLHADLVGLSAARTAAGAAAILEDFEAFLFKVRGCVSRGGEGRGGEGRGGVMRAQM